MGFAGLMIEGSAAPAGLGEGRLGGLNSPNPITTWVALLVKVLDGSSRSSGLIN